MRVAVILLLVGFAGCREPNEVPNDGCDPATVAGLTRCVDDARYRADVELVAQERVPESAHWQRVQDHCRDTLEGLGFTVELHDYGTGVNVVGVRTGTTIPGEQVLVSAHYDHIPGCPGADDNASGVAGALELARALSGAILARTLVVACWDEEELGLIGSDAYAKRADTRGDDIVAHVVYDLIAYASDEPGSQQVPDGFELLYPEEVEALIADEYRGDFIALVHDVASLDLVDAFDVHAARLSLDTVALGLGDDLKNSPFVIDLRRSDHAPFWLRDYPAVFVTDTANFRSGAYHCATATDDVAHLDFTFAGRVVRATVGAVAEALGLVAP